MGKRITKEELAALSDLTGIDRHIILKMHSLRLLDIPGCKSILIREEYFRYTQAGDSRKGMVLEMLSDKYRISRSLAEKIIYNKDTNKYVCCTKCGKIISKYKYRKNLGICDICKQK